MRFCRKRPPAGKQCSLVDMTGTTFCESSGVGVLAQAHKRAQADGGELRLVIPASAAVLRKLAVTGIDRVIPNFPSLYEALELAPAAKPGMRTRGGGLPPDSGARTIMA